MRLGAFLPSFELGADLAAVRGFIEATDELGYDHLLIPDHVVGVDLARYPELAPRAMSDHRDAFREPLVLAGYAAAIAPRLEVVPHVLVLAQRQAVLVAKQASEVDLLSGGKLRLGTGIGWNEVEMEALGASWRTRASRFEEQVALLRALWTQPLVDFDGRHHQLHGVGINPLPVQRPIPIWIGAGSEPGLRRACRIADGISCPARLVDRTTANAPIADAGWASTYDQIHAWLVEYGRQPASFPIENAIFLDDGTPDDWHTQAEMFHSLGTTHLCLHTMTRFRPGAPPTVSFDEHIARLRAAQDALGSMQSAGRPP
jgi:probable F420-dependent oxidoreductase